MNIYFMKFIKRIIRGCKNLPKYGPHPGTSFLVIFTSVFILVGGIEHGIYGIIFGGLLVLFCLLPLYLYGAYSRAIDEENDKDDIINS